MTGYLGRGGEERRNSGCNLHRCLMACCNCGRLPRKVTRKRLLYVVFILSLASLLYTISRTSDTLKMRKYLRPRNFCAAAGNTTAAAIPSAVSLRSHPDDLKLWGGPRNNRASASAAHVLLFARTASSFRELTDYLGALRIKYKTSAAGRNLPDLIKLSRGGAGKYFLIIFEDVRDLYRMDKWNREILEKYCRQFRAGILGFLPSGPEPAGGERNETLPDVVHHTTAPFSFSSHLSVDQVRVVNHSSLRILRPDTEVTSNFVSNLWVAFDLLSDSLSPVLMANISIPGGAEQGAAASSTAPAASVERPIVLVESETADGIRKAFIGGTDAMKFWLVKVVVADMIQYLSNQQVYIPLTRYVLIDIDDIFVGTARLTRDDVTALVESQHRLAKLIKGFRYNLGFSGSYYRTGSYYENEGDDELVSLREKFWWFPHMWKHIQPHKFDNISDLVLRMELNKQFAMDKGLPVDNQYAVAPHHSGVYPVHQQLYDAWRSVWDIEVTSTEEYPNLRPAKRRRGFVHSGISVLPRQTCGLYTKNLYYEEYPGGPARLEEAIEGGELFQTLLTNPISIFMTHMPNYCCDRLAPYAFESVLNFATCYTNLDFRTVTPRQLADKYFQLFPDEKAATWSNPCEDHRHREIWSEKKSCQRLPHFLVIGPQKTGTTALYSFLQLHPSIQANYPSTETYEEIQFFNGKNYQKGIDWYMTFFPEGTNASWIFEKSATYFDGDYVPSRAHRLLPNANIVAILIPAERRAYSWYQHMRAHADPTAINMSFKQVVQAGADSPKAVLSLQSRCLEPGKYAVHLEKWLLFYRAKQLHIIDGEELKYDPVAVMNRLQHFLEISPFTDYRDKLVFDKRKGFYCQVGEDGNKKCLGKGKGRQYPPMDPETESWLRSYYKHHNEALVKLLSRLGYSTPTWLKEALDGAA